MAPAKSLDKVINSSQNGEGAKKVLKQVTRKPIDETKNEGFSELEYWKNKALELERQQKEDIYNPLSPNDMVEVVSLCYDKLNLNTKDHGEGNRYSFDSFGETKNIMLSELAQIKETQKNFARKGYFFINNASAVRQLGLEQDYKSILSLEKINEVISNSPNAEKLFKSTNQGQQGILVNMIIGMIMEGRTVDMNLVHKVSEISGININQRVADQKESIERNKLEN
jgi:hypothetical protein